MQFNLINDEELLSKFLDEARNQDELVFDYESSGLKTHSKDIKRVGIGFCWNTTEAYYLPFNSNLSEELVHSVSKELLENDSIKKIGHNVKYDVRLSDRFGIKVKNIHFDTIVASYCLYGDLYKHNLDDITLRHFNHVKIRTNSLIARKSKKNPNPTMLDSPVKDVATYCGEDVLFTYKLYKLFQSMLAMPNNKSIAKIFYEIDMPLVEVLCNIECSGVKIDTDKLNLLRDDISKKLLEITTKVDAVAGREVVYSNPADIRKLMYEDIKLEDEYGISAPVTSSNLKSTNAATLNIYKDNEVVQQLLEYKTLNKLMSTYITTLPEYISEHTGLMHPFFSQTRTSTGRLASSDPNAQNIPARTEIGKKIRGTFVSRWGNDGCILAADYSQAELRILAHASGEEVFIKAFLDDDDIHLRVASEVIYNIPKDQVTKEQRTIVKTINFGLLYGMRAKKLSVTLGIPLNDAVSIMQIYMSNMKGLNNFLDQARIDATRDGYSSTLFGRKRYVPNIYSEDQYLVWAAEREAANHIIQGTNADIIKMAMKQINDYLLDNNLKSKMILQVHDELVFDVHNSEKDFFKDSIQNIMQNVVKFKVPMKVSAEYADSWQEAH